MLNWILLNYLCGEDDYIILWTVIVNNLIEYIIKYYWINCVKVGDHNILWTVIMKILIIAKLNQSLNAIELLVLRRWYIILWTIIWENLIDVKWIHILLIWADVLEIFICILFVKLTFDKCENLYMLSFEYRLIIMKI